MTDCQMSLRSVHDGRSMAVAISGGGGDSVGYGVISRARTSAFISTLGAKCSLPR